MSLKFSSNCTFKKMYCTFVLLWLSEEGHMQYLNSKILHGGRFRSLDQTHLECESTLVEFYVIPLPKLNEDQKKGFLRKLKCFDPEIRRIPHTKSSCNLKDLFVLADFFSSDHPSLKSRWGDAKSR